MTISLVYSLTFLHFHFYSPQKLIGDDEAEAIEQAKRKKQARMKEKMDALLDVKKALPPVLEKKKKNPNNNKYKGNIDMSGHVQDSEGSPGSSRGNSPDGDRPGSRGSQLGSRAGSRPGSKAGSRKGTPSGDKKRGKRDSPFREGMSRNGSDASMNSDSTTSTNNTPNSNAKKKKKRRLKKLGQVQEDESDESRSVKSGHSKN